MSLLSTCLGGFLTGFALCLCSLCVTLQNQEVSCTGTSICPPPSVQLGQWAGREVTLKPCALCEMFLGL